MKIVIKGKEYEFSFDSIWGPLYSYEVIVGKKLPFNPAITLCMHIMYYCVLLRANPDFDLTFDDFIESLNDVKLVNAMSKYYANRMNVLTESDREDEKKKKPRVARKKKS